MAIRSKTFFVILQNVPLSSIQNIRKQKRTHIRQGLFRKNTTFAQRDTTDFGTLAIRNCNNNVISMTFDASNTFMLMIIANDRFSSQAYFNRNTHFLLI